MKNQIEESGKLAHLKEQRTWAISLLNHRPISPTVYRDWNIATTSAIQQAFGALHINVQHFKNATKFDINRNAPDADMYQWLESQKSLLNSFISQLESFDPAVDLPKSQPKVFLVHGHDAETKETVARFLQNLGLQPIILSEQAHQGRTIIQQIETYTEKVAFGIVLLTPDDVGETKDHTHSLKPRARQNVILELGFLMGRLGRNRVCAICRGDVEIPSDFHGILWTSWNKDWKIELIRELRAASIELSLNNI